MFANKLIEKIPDPHNAEEHHQSFLRTKKRKLVKRSEIIPYRPKTFKLSKTIRQAEKLGSNSSFYSDIKVKLF